MDITKLIGTAPPESEMESLILAQIEVRDWVKTKETPEVQTFQLKYVITGHKDGMSAAGRETYSDCWSNILDMYYDQAVARFPGLVNPQRPSNHSDFVLMKKNFICEFLSAICNEMRYRNLMSSNYDLATTDYNIASAVSVHFLMGFIESDSGPFIKSFVRTNHCVLERMDPNTDDFVITNSKEIVRFD